MAATSGAQAQMRSKPSTNPELSTAPSGEVPTGGPIRHPMKRNQRGGRVTVSGSGDQVVIQLGLDQTEAWSLNLATGQLSPTDPVPQDNVNPTTGIGVVIHKNPGSSANRAMPTSGGGASLPTDLEPGGYDIIVRIPPQSMPNARLSRPAKGSRVKFHVNVTPEGITRDRGATPQVSSMAINEKGTRNQNGKEH